MKFLRKMKMKISSLWLCWKALLLQGYIYLVDAVFIFTFGLYFIICNYALPLLLIPLHKDCNFVYIILEARHDVRNKNELLVLIRKFIEGIAVIDLKDVYSKVMEDLQALKAEGKIWMLSNFDFREDIAFPNDPKNATKGTEKRRCCVELGLGPVSSPSHLISHSVDIQEKPAQLHVLQFQP